MNAIHPVSRATCLLLVSLIFTGLTQAGNGDLQAQADKLYAAERYAEAHPLLEKLIEGDAASGNNLYRLAYCQRLAGAESTADATQARAVEVLEHEFSSANSVETPFYLANSYRAVGRLDDMRRIAAETTERVEQGDIASPTNGIAQFQLAKLYADQELEPAAREWYARAVDSLEQEGAGETYLRWSSRFLADRSWSDRDFEASQRYLKIVTDGGDAAASDFEKLAIASARTARYEQASTAWNETGRLDGSAADRSRYGARLATMAAKIAPLPEQTPTEQEWSALDQVALETLMREQADAVKAIQQEAGEQTLARETRIAYREQLAGHRRWLVAAALEYATRGHSIRQASFFGGYAPLILNTKGWVLPRVASEDTTDEGSDQPAERKKKKKKKRKRKKKADKNGD